MNKLISNHISNIFYFLCITALFFSSSGFSQTANKKSCIEQEFISELIQNFEVQLNQLYKVDKSHELYSSFLEYMSLDPFIDSWMVEVSKTDIVSYVKKHDCFNTIWKKQDFSQDIILEEVISDSASIVTENEIYDVSYETKFFKRVKDSEVETIQAIAEELEVIGGFLSPQFISSVLFRKLKESDYRKEEVKSFIVVNIYYTTLINLSTN